MKKLTKTTLAIAAGLFLAQSAFADPDVWNVASVNIYGNSDSSNNLEEGVFITSNAKFSGNGPINNDRAYLDLRTNGSARMVGASSAEVTGGVVYINGANGVGINGNTAVSGALGISGNSNVGGTLSVQGLSTTNGVNNAGVLNNTGALNQIGATNIIGATSINASGNANTTIGTLGGASVNTLQGAANNITAVDANTISGATNSLTSTTGGNVIAAATANTITAGTSNAITAVTSNTFSAATNNMTATAANNIQGPVNNIGTSASSANNIGNTVASTTVTSRAGNATQALANGIANTSVAQGASELTAASQQTSAQVLLSNAGGATVDANGKILANGATGSTAAVTLTNGLGNTHGLVVTESQTTLSGGAQSSSLTLTDRAATFSNAQTGAPITVTGVANGSADFDAVNVRQFAGAIAAVAAQANIPALAAGQDRTFGVGMGNFMGKTALAMGMSMRGDNNAVYKATLSSSLNGGARKAVAGVGGAWGF